MVEPPNSPSHQGPCIYTALIYFFYRCHVHPQRLPGVEANNPPELCAAGAFPRVFPRSRWAQLSRHKEATGIWAWLGVTPGRRRLCPGLEGAAGRAWGGRGAWRAEGPGQPWLLFTLITSPFLPAPLAPGPEAPLACPEPLEAERRLAARGPGRSAAPGGPWGRWRRPWRAHVGAGPRTRTRTLTAVTGAGTGWAAHLF